MTDESLFGFALQVLEKGGPVAFTVVVVVIGFSFLLAKLGWPRSSGTEAQMAEALKALSAQVQRNHETAEKQREDLRNAVSGHAERIGWLEGRMSTYDRRR